MAVIGYLGRSPEDCILFTASDSVIRALENIKWTGSARWSTHERHGTNALTEFTGVDVDGFTFEVTLTPELGVDPMEEMVKIWNYERSGEALALTLGEHAYGKYRWTITKHSFNVQYTDRNGDLYVVKASITLQEYLRK